jgi:hypothetical protein
MQIKNRAIKSIILLSLSIFLVSAVYPMTKAQRVTARASAALRKYPCPSVPQGQLSSATPKVGVPTRTFGSLPAQKRTSYNRFTSRSLPKVQQGRYFSSKAVTPVNNATLLLEAMQSGSKEKLFELIKKGRVW